MSLTSAQKAAIKARGNVLVAAGAGTGKTKTLVERCLTCLLEEEPPCALDELLVVTFTEAAATEMRRRLRQRLEETLEAHPNLHHVREQLGLFETAHIGTLHSFCFQLVREHFYEIELDPKISVVPDEEARLLAGETLEELLERYYSGQESSENRHGPSPALPSFEGSGGQPQVQAILDLIQTLGRGRDQVLRELVLRLHHYTQTLPDPEGWFEQQRLMFSTPNPTEWQRWLAKTLADWSKHTLARLELLAAGNDVAASCATALKPLTKLRSADVLGNSRLALERLQAAREACPRGRKGALLAPLEELFEEAEFLGSLLPAEAGLTPAAAPEGIPQTPNAEPLAQDWGWVRGQMLALLELTREFSRVFTSSKRELAVVDFHDLEQYTLRLLCEPGTGVLTPVARKWRKKLRFVFVDEYQDINAAQDRIIQSLSRESTSANRFLVGDVKQSIYRFRLANPQIFQKYAQSWDEGESKVIPLVENFRSQPAILDFVNSLFALLMKRETGGIDYDERARLRPGVALPSPAPGAAAARPRVEIHFRVKQRGAAKEETASVEDTNGPPLPQMDDADAEASLVARRLLALHAEAYPVWDEELGEWRPVRWKDMAVLLRAPSAKAENYAKEFSKLNVPLLLSRGGFYSSIEILDLINLLRVLDNPQQDLPLLAVLRSPLVGLSLSELANVRLACKGHYWNALVQWNAAPTAKKSAEAATKVGVFLERYARWRQLARQTSVAQCLEAVLTESHYGEWLLARERGEQRHANVRRLLDSARRFNLFQRHTLFRYLRFIEAQESVDREPMSPESSEQDSVRLLSIHQSKGLEFPVVAVADLGKAFNESDVRQSILLDEELGLCPEVRPPHSGLRYPSLPHWLATRRAKAELLGEELRLLYVAATRARDLLLLSGTVSAAKRERMSESSESGRPADAGTDPAKARNAADWVLIWLRQHAEPGSLQKERGFLASVAWTFYEQQGETRSPEIERQALPKAENPQENGHPPELFSALTDRLGWRYRNLASTRQPAKTSVTALRHAFDEPDEASLLLPGAAASRGRRKQPAAQRRGLRRSTSRTKTSNPDALTKLPSLLSAVDAGIAHHEFLRRLDLGRARSSEQLRLEAQRLENEGALTPAQAAALDFAGLAWFWNSDFGQKVRDQAHAVRRELPFTARFLPGELAELFGTSTAPELQNEFVVVQGVADLVVFQPAELWLADFKTDELSSEDLEEKAAEHGKQLKLYARALTRVFHLPVTQCWLHFLAAKASVLVP